MDGLVCTFVVRKQHSQGLAPLPMAYTFRSLFVLRECVIMLMTSTAEIYFRVIKTTSYKKTIYKYLKIRKAFSKFSHRHSELIVKYNTGLNTLLQRAYPNLYFMVI